MITGVLALCGGLLTVFVGKAVIKREIMGFFQHPSEEVVEGITDVVNGLADHVVAKVTGSLGGTISGISRGATAVGMEAVSSQIPGFGKIAKSNPWIAMFAPYILGALAKSQGSGNDGGGVSGGNPRGFE